MEAQKLCCRLEHLDNSVHESGFAVNLEETDGVLAKTVGNKK
jgi:hypothetical protein